MHATSVSTRAHRLNSYGALSQLQVVYPALDAKVKNVTLAYSVEHEDEVRHCRRAEMPHAGQSDWPVSLDALTTQNAIACTSKHICPLHQQERLFEQLSQLLNSAVAQTGRTEGRDCAAAGLQGEPWALA